MPRKQKQWHVPDEYMIPIGAKMTQELGICSDNFTINQCEEYRILLPEQYHAYPAESLRRQWDNIRKRGTAGYKLNGTGPSKGSRKIHRHVVPARYAGYLASEDWKSRRAVWLEYWKTCCVCDGIYRLDVHHRTYVRLGYEFFEDCIVLCHHCHYLYHSAGGNGPQSGTTGSLFPDEDGEK